MVPEGESSFPVGKSEAEGGKSYVGGREQTAATSADAHSYQISDGWLDDRPISAHSLHHTHVSVSGRAYWTTSLTQALQNLDYNVPGGKLNRGLSVVDTVEILKGRTLTDDEYFKAALLGWCVELVSLMLSMIVHVYS